MKWAGHVARMGHMRGARGFFLGEQRERGHVKYLGVDRREISKQIAKKWHGEARTEMICLRRGTGDERLWMR
jgi:hypothetical protein